MKEIEVDFLCEIVISKTSTPRPKKLPQASLSVTLNSQNILIFVAMETSKLWFSLVNNCPTASSAQKLALFMFGCG